MSSKVKNVFISHVHEDDDHLDELKALLKNNGMQVRDSSVHSGRPNNAKSPEYIKSGILAPRIDWAGAMIVYISRDTKDSEWVNWEIETAHKKGKTIVGVWERGAKDCEVPEALDQYGHALVGWNGNKIIDAVNGEYEKFETPDGDSLNPRSIKRHPCG